FFQAEDGIRDDLVTGVQTCALPISIFLPWIFLPSSLHRCKVVNVTSFMLIFTQAIAHRSIWANNRRAWTSKASSGPLNPVILKEIGRASCREREHIVLR